MSKFPLITLFILFSGLDCISQTYVPDDFTACTPPKVNSGLWYSLDTSRHSFTVTIVAGKLRISEAIPAIAKKCSLPEGDLLALDMGEWGGGLYYTPGDPLKGPIVVNGKLVKADNQLEKREVLLKSGDPARTFIKGKHALIESGNTPAIIPYNNYWIFIHSFTNALGNHGFVSRLTIHKDSFVVSDISDLKAIPNAIGMYKHQIFAVTNNSFLVFGEVGGQWKKRLSLENMVWDGLYPNSIAAFSESSVYVGMRGGYAKLDLTKNSVTFYSYKKN